MRSPYRHSILAHQYEDASIRPVSHSISSPQTQKNNNHKNKIQQHCCHLTPLSSSHKLARKFQHWNWVNTPQVLLVYADVFVNETSRTPWNFQLRSMLHGYNCRIFCNDHLCVSETTICELLWPFLVVCKLWHLPFQSVVESGYIANQSNSCMNSLKFANRSRVFKMELMNIHDIFWFD